MTGAGRTGQLCPGWHCCLCLVPATWGALPEPCASRSRRGLGTVLTMLAEPRQPQLPLPSCCAVCRCCSCPPPPWRAPHPEQHPVPCPQLHWGMLLLSAGGALSGMSVPGTPVPRLLCVVSALGGLQDGGSCRWPCWVLWWPCWLAIAMCDTSDKSHGKDQVLVEGLCVSVCVWEGVLGGGCPLH